MGDATKTDAKARTARVADPEIQALSKLDTILADLSDDECMRCLVWLNDRYVPGGVLFTRLPGTKPQE